MCCDSSAPANPTSDPQVGEAALQQSAVAQQEANFTENYMNTVETPAVQQETAAAAQSQAEQQQLFGINYAQTQAQSKMYTQNALPAQQNYYNMVNQYSQPGQQEADAMAAEGDVTNAAAVQQQALNRNLASRGVSANSGMAINAQAQAAQSNTANAAAAANQARNAARSLGMNLTSTAAGFGNNSASTVTGFGGAASGNSMNSYNVAAGAVSAGNAGAALPMQSYQSQANIYGSQMSNYMQGAIANQNNQTSAQNSSNAGIGSALGGIAGMFSFNYGS